MALKSTLREQRDRVISGIADYTQNMFQNGNNRTATDKKAHDAPAYDRAAHRGDAGPDILPGGSHVDTSHSRDGTDAVGRDDEDGGHLGGTEEELDSLEAGATPVDRNPRMQH